ncbi:unnamed protein product [Closterium sp. NIES-65]|nr:unnamed protein product [Closterium sp. NIES-65]
MPPAGAAAAAAAAAKGAPTSVQPLPVAAINGGAGSGAGGASGTGSGAAGGTALGVAGAGNAVKAPMMVFTPREDVALEDLERILPPLGFGSGGRVYRVRHKKTGKEYALKVIQEKYDEEVRKQIIQEMQILRRARSDHVVECYGIFDHLGEISFVLELMDGGTLADVTKKRGKIPESFMPEVTRQCLQGLLYLHRQHVVHRDIKPSNLLFNRQGQVKIADFGVKIADFGVSKELASTLAQCNSYVDTSAYLSPERINPPPGEGYNGYLSDVWSMGLSLLELSSLLSLLLFVIDPFSSASVIPPPLSQVKIADFGVSKELASTLAQCNSYVGTSAYLSPERINPPPGEGYDGYLSDVWSMGLSLLELVIGRFPYVQAGQSADWMTLFGAIVFNEPPEAPGSCSPEFQDFIRCSPSQLPTSFGRQEKVKRKYDEVVIDARKAAVGPGEEDLSVVAAQSTRQSRGRQAQRRDSPDRTAENDGQADVVDVPSYEGMDARQKKLFEIRLKLNQARLANQTAVVAEKRREEKPEEESRGVSKAAWFEEKKRKMSKQLDAAGLHITKVFPRHVLTSFPLPPPPLSFPFSLHPRAPAGLRSPFPLFPLLPPQNQARKANQTAVVAEKRREEKPEEEESRGVSKAAWFEEKKRKMSKQLDAAGLDITKAYMLETQEAAESKYKKWEKKEAPFGWDGGEGGGLGKKVWEKGGLDITKAYMLETQEAAESKYKKWEKKEAPFGWDAFNQQALYNAYKKRTGNIPYTEEDYLKAKEKDPDFYRDDASLQYGQAPEIPEENVDRMVAELTDRAKSRKEFSRRRRHHDEKDIDSINDRNEHFNRKIERAFGKYTVEIKNNLERGTALPD